LYGRRLVIEWASQDETIEHLRAKTARLASLSKSKDGTEQQNSEGGSTKMLNRYLQSHAPSANADQDEDADE